MDDRRNSKSFRKLILVVTLTLVANEILGPVGLLLAILYFCI